MKNEQWIKKHLIVVRGGGDLATGTIHRLWSAGYPVVILETEKPAAIRRQVSLCEAIYDGEAEVENLHAICVKDVEDAIRVLEKDMVPVLIDPQAQKLTELKPEILIDAIIAKENLGTTKEMAPLTIALGPGFCAGKDVDLVVETKRGHNLGRIITEGYAEKNSGIPGVIGGYGKERVIHAECPGIFYNKKKIGDIVERGEVIGWIEKEDRKTCVKATISGLLRGLLRDDYPVTEGFKIADIDPRIEEQKNCFTISDKSRCIAGSVLEAVCKYYVENGKNT